jgi:transposase-like protein
MPKRSRTHRTPRRGRRSPETEAKYLKALEGGKSIAAAAATAGVGGRTVYDWRQSDAEFAALRFAKQGDARLIIALLKARRPERYARTLLDGTGSLGALLEAATASLGDKLARLGQP